VSRIKILLGDPRHSTVGEHSNFVPIGIGYIGTNLLKQFENYNLELKIETKTEKILALLETWKPDIVGLSHYVWNKFLSKFMCTYAKKINPDCLCVLGGPEFPAGTGARKIENNDRDKTYDKCLSYLISMPSVDYFSYSDGEVTFLEIVRNYINNNCSIKLMKDKDKSMKGCAYVSKDKNKLVVGEYFPRIGMDGSVKVAGRDIVPSPYTTGLLDKFLDGTYTPAFETARGCPFMCSFCHQGIDASKIATFSVKRVAEEFEYVGKKLSHLKNGTKDVYIFDNNWGIFQKDIEVSDRILKIMEKYDWPQFIECSSPKEKRENLLAINDRLKNRVQIQQSIQSTDHNVLANIKRTNITRKEYIDYLKETEKRGRNAISEIIIPLPGESEKTYFEGVKFLMEHNVQTVTFTLMILPGSEIAFDQSVKKYALKTKYRVLPKQFGEYKTKKIFEIESVCVATNTMSFQSYLNCRNYSFIVSLLASSMFIPIYKLLNKLDISWYDFSKELFNTIKDKKYQGKFKDIYNGFCEESLNELFNSKEEAIKFYLKPENYKSLIQGDIGENLISKYTVKSFLAVDDIYTTIFYVIKNKYNKGYNEELNSILNSSEKWLKNLHMINIIIADKKISKKNNKHLLKLDFDFPGWIAKTHLPLERFNKISTYSLYCDFKKVNNIRNEIKNILGTNKNGYKERAFGRFLSRRGLTQFDFLEKNFQKLN
jgi:radical SAM superfamily enzyme YgiQ (UPF0313 family)